MSKRGEIAFMLEEIWGLPESAEVVRAAERELAEAKEQILAYQVRVDNDALRMANLAHPVTADRFSRG